MWNVCSKKKGPSITITLTYDHKYNQITVEPLFYTSEWTEQKWCKLREMVYNTL
jgi:hypothetical protein